MIPYFDIVDASEQHAHSSGQQNQNEHKILHTNDIHGRFVEEKGSVIGMPKLKGLKNKENPDLMLDSGDAFRGCLSRITCIQPLKGRRNGKSDEQSRL